MKYKLSQKNLDKVNEFFSSASTDILPEINDSFKQLITAKVNDINYLPGYRLLRSFDNINFLNETENFF